MTSFLLAYFNYRTIFNGGLLIMGIAMTIVAVLAVEDLDTLLVVVIMIFLLAYQWTLGTWSWVYMG